MKDSKPKLPEKLPIEARKKLSVSTINFEDDLAVTTQIPNHSLPKNHEDDENYIYSIYVNPIDQPSMQRSQSALTEESEELKFFNDSIYFKYPDSTSSNETDLDDYSSLALFSSERSRTLVKTTENNVDENSDCKLNSTVHYLIDVANTSPKPPIPPKSNKLSSQLSKLSLTNSYSVENTTKKRNSLEEEMLNYIQPSDKKAYLFGTFPLRIPVKKILKVNFQNFYLKIKSEKLFRHFIFNLITGFKKQMSISIIYFHILLIMTIPGIEEYF